MDHVTGFRAMIALGEKGHEDASRVRSHCRHGFELQTEAENESGQAPQEKGATCCKERLTGVMYIIGNYIHEYS